MTLEELKLQAQKTKSCMEKGCDSCEWVSVGTEELIAMIEELLAARRMREFLIPANDPMLENFGAPMCMALKAYDSARGEG